jgi:Arginyl-tRNA synthetase
VHYIKYYKKLGYNVVGINHLGDYGTQFGKLIVAYKLWSSREKSTKAESEPCKRYTSNSIRRRKPIPSSPIWQENGFLKVEAKDPEAMELF